uniref:Uncharacterized protein n=1 Tax=Leersia perrieri TaxID=77586 RepID=A0A0D9UZA6_9ORYZ
MKEHRDQILPKRGEVVSLTPPRGTIAACGANASGSASPVPLPPFSEWRQQSTPPECTIASRWDARPFFRRRATLWPGLTTRRRRQYFATSDGAVPKPIVEDDNHDGRWMRRRPVMAAATQRRRRPIVAMSTAAKRRWPRQPFEAPARRWQQEMAVNGWRRGRFSHAAAMRRVPRARRSADGFAT